MDLKRSAVRKVGGTPAVHCGLLEHVGNAVLAGRRGAQLNKDAIAQASRTLARLESGLVDYPTSSH
jgi:hypothetical protein